MRVCRVTASTRASPRLLHDQVVIDSPYVPSLRWAPCRGGRRGPLRRVRLADVPDSPSSPPESPGPHPNAGRASPASRSKPQRGARATNAAERTRIQSRRAARICRNCPLPAVTRDYCARHRAAHNPSGGPAGGEPLDRPCRPGRRERAAPRRGRCSRRASRLGRKP